MKLDKEIIKYFKKWQQETCSYQGIDIDKVDFEKVALSDERYFELNPKKSEIQQDLKDQNIEVSFIPLEKINPIVGKIDPQNTRNINDVLTGYTYFREGDVIFTKVTPSMENGNTAIAEKLVNGIGFGSSEYYVFRCKGFINKLLWHYLRTKSLRDQAKPTMTGSGGLKRVPKDFFSTVSILIPASGDLDFQNAILNFIEHYKAKFDAYRQVASALRSKIESFDKAFLPAIFSSEKEPFIVEKFNKWAEGRGYGLKFDEIEFSIGKIVGDPIHDNIICEKRMGFTPRISEYGDVPWFTVGDLGSVNDLYINEPVTKNKTSIDLIKEKVDARGTGKSEKLIPIKKGDVLVSFKLTVGVAKVYNSELFSYCNEAIDILTPKVGYLSSYLAYNCMIEYPKRGTKTNNGYTLNDDSKSEIELLIPNETENLSSFEIQKIIVEFIEHWQDWKAEIFKRIDELERNINLTEEVLIAKVFKGAEE